MTPVLAIARRELFSYLLSPVGYAVTAMFLFFTSLVFFAAAPLLSGSGFAPGQPASLRMFFEVGVSTTRRPVASLNDNENASRTRVKSSWIPDMTQ